MRVSIDYLRCWTSVYFEVVVERGHFDVTWEIEIS